MSSTSRVPRERRGGRGARLPRGAGSELEASRVVRQHRQPRVVAAELTPGAAPAQGGPAGCATHRGQHGGDDRAPLQGSPGGVLPLDGGDP